MDVILGVIIGLVVGILIGFLVKSGRSNSDSSDNPLVKDLKEQLEREKNSTAAATKLSDELETMKKTVEKLTEASSAADLRRVRAETEITEQVKSMASHNENLVKQTRAIAGALGAKRLIFLTDVPGVLDKNKKIIEELKITDIPDLIADGTITGGMIPKVETCMYAIERGVEGVVILDGKLPHAVLIELLTDHGAGTLITR